MGIIHQVNLEFLAKCVFLRNATPAGPVALPDTLVGTDSHTTMINGLGVVGWGVGGIEAEAVMLGQPLYMLAPEVIGFELGGELPAGATATDLVLTVTQILRTEGVVDKFVEFFGPALAGMKVADRALVANMSPEYGATMGFFPIDEQTLGYLRETGRTDEEVELVERYAKEQHLFRSIAASAAGGLHAPLHQGAAPRSGDHRAEPGRTQTAAGPRAARRRATVVPPRTAIAAEGTRLRALRGTSPPNGRSSPATGAIGHGAVVIASITSCTNTSNPSVMLAAGLLARKAVERGLKVKPHVKTSLAPGSRVVTDYLRLAGLDKPLEQLGFHTVGYGCMTCIGNSGPLPEAVAKAVGEGQLVAAAVLSGNRNFEGRINPLVKANYLASPPLVVAYALAGTVDIDLSTASRWARAATGGRSILKDIWPSPAEIAAAVSAGRPARDVPQALRRRVRGQRDVEPHRGAGAELFPWDPDSTYIQEPPFLLDLAAEPGPIRPILGARVLAALGDSVTTDHISPAGSIAGSSPAGNISASEASRRSISTATGRGEETIGSWRAARLPTSASATNWRRAPKAASPATCPTASSCRSTTPP